MVRRIKDDLIDTLNFRNKLEIAISAILILQVCFLKVKRKVNKKVRRNNARFHFLFALRYPIQKLEIPNLKFEIHIEAKKRWVNTQLPPILIWSYVLFQNPSESSIELNIIFTLISASNVALFSLATVLFNIFIISSDCFLYRLLNSSRYLKKLTKSFYAYKSNIEDKIFKPIMLIFSIYIFTFSR